MNRRTLTFALAGKPRGKGRPRFTNRGGYVKTYTDADTVAYEGGIARVARQALAGAPPLTGPLAAFVRVCVGVPASASKKAQAAMLAGETYPTKVPDLDNIIKGVLDGCNKVAFADDKQIVDLHSTKRYGAEPGVTVTLTELAA